MTPKDPELAAVVRDLEAALGPEDLDKAQRQLWKDELKFFVGLGMPLLLALLWLPTGWAVALRDALHANATWWGTWGALLVFLFVGYVVKLPVNWFLDYHLETQLGTVRQSVWGWLWDGFRRQVFSILLTSLMFLGLYLVFRRWPDRWLLGLVALTVLVLGAMVLLAPLMLRTQHNARPLDNPDLTERLRRLFERAGVPFGGLNVLEVSEKTTYVGASLVPQKMGTQVVVYDTLLESGSPEEIEALVAHELGHKVHRDVLRQMMWMALSFSLTLAVGYGVLQAWGARGGLQGPADVATFPLLSLVWNWLEAGFQVVTNAMIRRQEREADRFALEMTNNPAAFERVMVLAAQRNKDLPLAPAWAEFLLYSHPSPARRILMARRWGRERAPQASRAV